MRPMKDAPRDGTPIAVKSGNWVATVKLGPNDPDHWANAGDTLIHYNGESLLSRFRGVYEGWWPVDEFTPKAALTEARAQGAAEERERLARLADKNANSEDCLKPDVAAWNDIAVWLRSQKDQHHD